MQEMWETRVQSLGQTDPQYLMDRGAWRAIVHGLGHNWATHCAHTPTYPITQLSSARARAHTHTHTHTHSNWLTLGPRTSNGRAGIQGRQSHTWAHTPRHLLANTQNYLFQEMCWEECRALILTACIPTPQHCIHPSSQESHRDLKNGSWSTSVATLLLIIPQLAISQRTPTSTSLCPSSCTKEIDLSEHTLRCPLSSRSLLPLPVQASCTLSGLSTCRASPHPWACVCAVPLDGNLLLLYSLQTKTWSSFLHGIFPNHPLKKKI